MKIRFLVFALVFSVLLTLCACDTQEGKDNSNASNVSDVSVPEKLPDGAVRISTDKESYAFDEKVVFKIEVDSDEEFNYGYDYFIEFLDSDGVWKKCEKEYSYIEVAVVGKRESEMEFVLSERADEGKEKYRIVAKIHTGGYSYEVRSNEFTAK